jgi:hypothetical protein
LVAVVSDVGEHQSYVDPRNPLGQRLVGEKSRDGVDELRGAGEAANAGLPGRRLGNGAGARAATGKADAGQHAD